VNRRQFLSSVVAAPFIAALKPENPLDKFFDMKKIEAIDWGIDWGSKPDWTIHGIPYHQRERGLV